MPGRDAAPPNGIVFGPAELADLDALVSLDRDSPQPWSRDAFSAELHHEPSTLFVLRSSAEAVAFAVVRIGIPEMDIVNLAVQPSLRGRGLGRFLLRCLIDRGVSAGVQRVFLEVREGNQEARKLYRSAGFKETQRRPGFYLNPAEDAILMRFEMSNGTG